MGIVGVTVADGLTRVKPFGSPISPFLSLLAGSVKRTGRFSVKLTPTISYYLLLTEKIPQKHHPRIGDLNVFLQRLAVYHTMGQSHTHKMAHGRMVGKHGKFQFMTIMLLYLPIIYLKLILMKS